MQEQRYLGHLEPDMDVCDIDGNKIGTIGRVYRHELATVGAASSESGGGMPREDVIEVKTGLLGLGKHFYIPFGSIQDVTSGCVFINVPKDRVENQGWEIRPDYLEEMS
jgi:hypothetical protein